MLNASARRLALIATALLLAGCCGKSCPPKNQPAATTRPSAAATETHEYPIIVRLVSRSQTLTVSAGPQAALYSVRSADGQLLVSQATLDELRIQHPQLFRWI